MKRIIKNSEPPSFSDWKGQTINNRQPDYSDLRNPEKHLLKQSLIEEQGGICCYCEIRVIPDNSHIEHFVPQNNPSCNNLDYVNMLSSCQKQTPRGAPRHCGKSKDHDDGCDYDLHLLISPLDTDCENQFEYDKRGNIIPIKDSNGNSDPKSEFSINCLKLNIEKLRKARENMIVGILECLAEGEIQTEFIDHYLQRDANGSLPEFYTAIKYLFGD